MIFMKAFKTTALCNKFGALSICLYVLGLFSSWTLSGLSLIPCIPCIMFLQIKKVLNPEVIKLQMNKCTAHLKHASFICFYVFSAFFSIIFSMIAGPGLGHGEIVSFYSNFGIKLISKYVFTLICQRYVVDTVNSQCTEVALVYSVQCTLCIMRTKTLAKMHCLGLTVRA